MTKYVLLASTADAVSLAAFLDQRGVQADRCDSTVTLDPDALVILRDLDDQHDGHYDGGQIWVGGTGYPLM